MPRSKRLDRKLTARTTALAALVHWGAALAAGDYRIGDSRSQQQGNFCEDPARVDELVDLFQRFGAPTGYAALSASPGCALQVHSFTPRSLYKKVKVTLSDGGFYTIRFIRVELADGRPMILVTTRDLLEPRAGEQDASPRSTDFWTWTQRA